MKLTDNMKKALIGMRETGKGSAYGLRVSLATMSALRARDLVTPHSSLGWGFSPQTCAWRLTDAGLKAANEVSE